MLGSSPRAAAAGLTNIAGSCCCYALLDARVGVCVRCAGAVESLTCEARPVLASRWLLTTRTRPYLFAESVRGPLRKARARGARLLGSGNDNQASLCARPPLVVDACQPASSSCGPDARLGTCPPVLVDLPTSAHGAHSSKINGQQRLRPHASRCACLPCHGGVGALRDESQGTNRAFAASCLGAPGVTDRRRVCTQQEWPPARR